MSALPELLRTSLALGLDSLIAGLTVGPLLASWRGRAACAVSFGVCDGGASWLGSMIPHQLPDIPDFLLYLACVALLVAGALRSRAWLFALPLILSLDNLAAGASAADAPLLGLSSATMAAAGLALGGVGRIAVVKLIGGQAVTKWASR